MRENGGRGRSRNNEQIAWQRVVGYFASRRTGAPSHLTLRFATASYVKKDVGLCPRERGRRKRRLKIGGGREKRKRRTSLRLHLG